MGPAPAPWCSRDPPGGSGRAAPSLPRRVMGREVVRLPGDDDAAAWVVAVAGALAGEGADAARRLQVLVGATAAPALPRRPVGARAARMPALRPGVLAAVGRLRLAAAAARAPGGGLPGGALRALRRAGWPRGGAVIRRRRRGALWMALAGAAGPARGARDPARVGAARRRGLGPRRPRAARRRACSSTTTVAAEALAPAPVPAGLALPGLLASAEEAVGRRTAAPVAAGEPLTQAALGGAPGRRRGPARRRRARRRRPAVGGRRGAAGLAVPARASTSSRRPARGRRPDARSSSPTPRCWRRAAGRRPRAAWRPRARPSSG